MPKRHRTTPRNEYARRGISGRLPANEESVTGDAVRRSPNADLVSRNKLCETVMLLSAEGQTQCRFQNVPVGCLSYPVFWRTESWARHSVPRQKSYTCEMKDLGRLDSVFSLKFFHDRVAPTFLGWLVSFLSVAGRTSSSKTWLSVGNCWLARATTCRRLLPATTVLGCVESAGRVEAASRFVTPEPQFTN